MAAKATVKKLFSLGDTALETDEGIYFFETDSIELEFPDLLEDPCVKQHYYPVHSVQ